MIRKTKSVTLCTKLQAEATAFKMRTSPAGPMAR